MSEGMCEKAKYVNFPISLLSGAFENIETVVDNIIHYAVYRHSLNLEIGGEIRRMRDSSNFFNVKFGNIERSIERAKKIYCSVKKGTPFASVKLKMLWDYHDNQKKECEIACFCAFCAIKSSIGDKDYVKTNKRLVVARMFGFTDIESLESISMQRIGVKTENLIRKYSLRYHIDNVILELKKNWGLKLYSEHSRGFYLSFSLSVEELAVTCFEDKTDSKYKYLSKKKSKSHEYALRSKSVC